MRIPQLPVPEPQVTALGIATMAVLIGLCALFALLAHWVPEPLQVLTYLTCAWPAYVGFAYSTRVRESNAPEQEHVR